MKDSPRCICLTGPTACGKTDIALQLAARVPIEIVSMDSAMVYRGMDIGTAKPSVSARETVPHHLIDIIDPTERYSAGRFADDAARTVRDIHDRGKVPLLVGGTLLYLKAFREGLAALPEADLQLRRRIDEEADRVGWPSMHRRLAKLDPATGRRIAPTDRQRIQRALEVIELTGRRVSELLANPTGAQREILTIALVPVDRAGLAERIERRFDMMVEKGFIAEVAALMARGDLTPAAPAMRAVGYRQLWAHLAGESDWAQARRRAIAATRQLAKRQTTWLRGEKAAETLSAFAPDVLDVVTKRVQEAIARWA